MSVTNVWTEGVCGDGAAILRNGTLMTISNVLEALNDRERLVAVNADLLAALKDILPWHDSHPAEATDNPVIIRCRAAIAKAEGSESNQQRKAGTVTNG